MRHFLLKLLNNANYDRGLLFPLLFIHSSFYWLKKIMRLLGKN